MPDKTPKRHQIPRRPVVKKTKARLPLRRFVFDGELYVGLVTPEIYPPMQHYWCQQAYTLWRGERKRSQPLKILWPGLKEYHFCPCGYCDPPPEYRLHSITPRELAGYVRQAREQGWTGALRTPIPFELVVDDVSEDHSRMGISVGQ
ncbi:hypothetical protein HNQ39_004228 [Armatimonas rosea]|uniref:Uncharacterized protein n=1 Tax=Armatimonas rosea TaxID=685828 RepID=A0A7W9ST78_ARMRO|nr:hypothetical protein [Armatimonas rosea]